MTAQEIADSYGDPCWVGTLKKEIESYAAERVDECREQTVRECAEAAFKAWERQSDESFMWREIHLAILSVTEPKLPVWQHREGCPTPYQWRNDIKPWACKHILTGEELSLLNPAYLCCCPGCGAEKPKETR